MSVLLNLSNTHAFWQGRDPEPLEAIHRASFLAFPQDPNADVHQARDALARLVAEAQGQSVDENSLAKIESVQDPVVYQSFWNHGQTRHVIPIVVKRSYWTPDVSDRLFFDHGFYTCEHDIPYRERASADLAAEKGWWLLDTQGHPKSLSVLTYDIETTQYGNGGVRDPTDDDDAMPKAGKGLPTNLPIDIIGYSRFDVEYQAQKELEREQFDFEFRDLPNDWSSPEVVQLVARNLDEEIDHLEQFTRHAMRHDIIAGHNILGFDNKQIHDRIQGLLQADARKQSLSPGTKAWFQTFTSVHSRPDRSFHFGTSQDTANWFPISLDTFHAARKFYFFHDDFTLKGLAPWLGIHVPDRVYLDPHEMDLGPKTLLYNKHDVQEQLGVTQALIAQALPLCFTVNLPLDDLLTGGNTRMWDHMAFLRGRARRKIMPATSRAQGVARGIQRLLPRTPFPTRTQISQAVMEMAGEERASSTNKELVRVAKQGPEMPFWCEHPGVIAKPQGASWGDPGDSTGYAIPGGMTLKPDSELHSHFVPWFHVVAADVGAMYPTILKARNLTADTVRPARVDEVPDDWLWLFELDPAFIESGKFHVRKADAEKDRFTKGRGWMIGVRHHNEPGMVNLAMTGVMDTIQKVKSARAQAKRSHADPNRIRILDMTYASLKAARNAGTHGILVAVNVSCRQFNVWGGANITTIGQRILHGTLEDWEAKGIRVVYGDTDGIYMACSKSAGNLPHLAAALGADLEPQEDKWITMPQAALDIVAAANRKWRDELEYEGFELEAETHDAMIFVVHKNYLIFDAKPDASGVVMETKGNNFKGSDKAGLAKRLLGDIMALALREAASWDDEEKGRLAMQSAIKKATTQVMSGLQVAQTPWEDLVLRQNVSAIRSYEPNPDGSLRVQAVRTAALEDLLGEPITSSRKVKFIVCKDPLPLYKDVLRQEQKKAELARNGYQLNVKEPKNRGLKPIEYMWPVEKVEPHMVDWAWYKSMVEDYVKGAFGFPSLELAVQRDLSSWF